MTELKNALNLIRNSMDKFVELRDNIDDEELRKTIIQIIQEFKIKESVISTRIINEFQTKKI